MDDNKKLLFLLKKKYQILGQQTAKPNKAKKNFE
jgi:hypothetical protein